MAEKRKASRLTAEAVVSAGPGRYADGNNLWLFVTEAGSRSWIYWYMQNRRAHHLGLGGLRLDSLGPGHANRLKRAKAELDRARREATRLTDLRRQGIDPAQQRQEAKQAARAQAAAAVVRGITFRTVAERYIAAHRAWWKNPKHAAQWPSTLQTYAYPLIGDLPVAEMATGHVTQILEPIWTTKTETATRLRGRLETVLDYARVHGWRRARIRRGGVATWIMFWRRRARSRRQATIRPCPTAELPSFIRRLRAQEGVAALALRWVILTAAAHGRSTGRDLGRDRHRRQDLDDTSPADEGGKGTSRTAFRRRAGRAARREGARQQ